MKVLALVTLIAFLISGCLSLGHSVDQTQRARDVLSSFQKQRDAVMAVPGAASNEMAHDINTRLARGEDMSCSLQILRDLRWAVTFTTNRHLADSLAVKLKASLTQKQDHADLQSSTDGLFGQCYEQEFSKLYATKIFLDRDPALDSQLLPFRFLDKYNSPEKLNTFLAALIKNDVTRSGEFARVRIDDTISSLGRFIMAERPKNYAFHPKLRDTYLNFLENTWRNPETKMWGTWIVGRDGEILKSDDVILTFKIINQREGRVSFLPQVAMRALQLKHIGFPFGYRIHGAYENHLNWGVVKIFRWAWPELNVTERSQVQNEIAQMLEWSLKESLQKDGGFRPSELDSTADEAMENGIEFLAQVGYFDASKRFWTDEKFLESAEVKKRIRAKLATMNAQNWLVQQALKSIQD